MQNYTWYSNSLNLNSPATIHQILAYGSFSAIKDAEKRIGTEKLKEIFIKKPQKVYTPSMFNFIAKYILNVSQPIDESRYLKTTPRNIG